MPNVLHLTPGFPTNDSDDVCIPALQDYLEALIGRTQPDQHQIVTLHYPATVDRYTWRDATVHAMGCRNNLLLRTLDLGRVARHVRQLHRANPFDAVIGYFLNDAALVASRFARRCKVPLVLVAMGQDVLSSNRYLGLLSRIWLQPAWRHLVAPSDRAAALLRDNFASSPNVQVIPWGVTSSQQQIDGSRSIDLIGVGSLTGDKSYETLIRTAAALRDTLQRVVLIGDGPERSNLVQLAQTLGVGELVEFWGQRSRQTTRKAMQDAHVLVHPSRYESFGLVFAEALDAGLAIVSRPVGIAPTTSVGANVDGWSVVQDSDAFPGEVRRVLEALRTGAKPPSLRFNVEATCTAYEQLLHEVVKAASKLKNSQ